MSFQEKAKIFFEIDEEQIQSMLENIRFNLKDGNIKFVILMDSIDERLKDLIIYVNQNSQFDIYAVQLEYYKFQEYEIMIPKIFGVEVKKNIKTSSGTRRNWTKEEFLKDANEKSDKYVYGVVNELLEFSYQNADKIIYGTGNQGCFSYKLRTPKGEITPLLVYSDGEVYASLGFIKYQDKVPHKFIDELINQFRKIKGGQETMTPSIKFFFNKPKKEETEQIKKSIREFTKKIKK